ncbi:zinc finger protein swm isoform X2 [Aricia agestis]|uniref:zinc finger protein swm isoform X2 n=1 Tax=Aricia agestis TaxID=91739 RepID=UPI001C20C3BC|nr:zinc finger protein swm isoform X2 [Aricia agestis]
MIIENPDAFKSWLTSILEPLCDADPAALAKYVYALVKKDKALDELRDGMLDQLDVFLQQETKPFVDMLFKALETQEYLKSVAPAEKKQPTPPPEVADTKEEKEPEVENNVAPPPAERVPVRERLDTHRVVVPRTRPLPPQHEHTLVKVMPTELLEEPVEAPRRRDRRTESLRDKEERRRRRSRSWERRGRRRPREEHERRPLNRRPPSRSPSPRGRYRNRSPPPAVERHTSRSRSRSPATRDRDAALLRTRELERDRVSRDREHRDRVSRSRDRERSRDRSRDRSMSPHETRLDHNDAYKRRCRDFDVKGYCMRGDLCEWDHGVDPVVLEDATLTRVLAIPPPVPEYNPAAPDIWGGGVGGFPPHAHPPHLPHHLAPRELVPIPRVRQDVPPDGAAMPPPLGPRHPAPIKKNFDYNRLYQNPRNNSGPRPPLPANAGNRSLEVKKVPRGLNDITHLNNHFSKFGKIVNIQVCFEGDPEAALITFSTPTEANVAYKSTEAVLNNRFIKVFWHNPENKQENTAPAGQNQAKPAERTNAYASHNKVLINRDNIKATADIKQQATEKAKEANGVENKPEPVTNPIVKAKPVLSDVQRRAQEQKRAQELLDSQIQQQKQLIQRLESGKTTEQENVLLLKAIKETQEGIEKLQKELVVLNGVLMRDESVARSMSRLQLNQTAMKPKTAQEAQKEILDAELDIITKQQEGQDVTELIKKIALMRKQMAIQFPTHPIARRPHSSYRIMKRKLRGGRFNPAMRYTRGAAPPKYSVNQTVDHRPKALLISGFETDELDAVQAHFAQFGEITGKDVNMSVPELRLQFAARAHAEQALARGRHYNDRTLSITWVTNNKPFPMNVAAPAHNGESMQTDTKEVEPQELSEDALLRFDEEDEEEEDRSWRR